TPEATVGIRGTIVSLRMSNGVTTVYVENTLRRVYVNGINVPGGNKITIPSDPLRFEPIRPQDRQDLGRDLAMRGRASEGSPTFFASSGLGLTPPPDTPLADIGLEKQRLGENMFSERSGKFEASGWGSATNGYDYDVSFGGIVNLDTGAISNGYFIIDSSSPADGEIVANMINGTGSAGPSSFDMYASGLNTGTNSVLPQGNMVYARAYGVIDLRAASDGDAFKAGYSVSASSGGNPIHESPSANLDGIFNTIP
ncbi:MAG: hypothetical protein FWF99_07760, partial [Desulfovibrionaceae bacterium]|nr:hypothetical protein [Desulfovibrionaceae bacterium]